MKRFYSFFIFIILFSTFIFPIYAIPPHKTIKPLTPITSPSSLPNSNWQLYLNQNLMTNKSITVINNTKYVPIDFVSNIGSKLSIDPKEKKAYILNPKEVYILSDNSKLTDYNGLKIRLSKEAVWLNNTLYIPLDFLVNLGASISVKNLENKINVFKNFNQINDIKFFSTDFSTKLIVEASQTLVYDTTDNINTLKIRLFGVENNKNININIPSNEKLIEKINIVDIEKGIVEITINKSYQTPSYIYLNNNNLIIEFIKTFTKDSIIGLPKGVVYKNIYKGQTYGPLNINVLFINPNQVDILPVLSLSKTGTFSLQRPTEIIKNINNIAGINGTYFSPQHKLPLGLLIISSELISSSIFNRASFFVTTKNDVFIQQASLSNFLFIEDKNLSIEFHGVNTIKYNNQLILYTPKYGKSTKTNFDNNSIELAVSSDGTVVNISDNNIEIPKDGYAILGTGKYKNFLLENVNLNSRVLIYSDYSKVNKEIKHAISGGPILLKDKKINITGTEEKFKDDILKSRAPRTAIGITEDKRVIFITIDGRQKNLSVGVTLEELASLMQQLGAVDAMNMDGGGSSTMFINKKIINYPSDGQERPVSNVIIVR